MADLLTRTQLLQSRREQFTEAASATRRFESAAKWNLGGFRIQTPVKDRLALVQVDPKLTEMVIGLMEQIAPSMADAYTRHLVPVAESALDSWPVLSGFSKSLLGIEFTVSQDGLTFIGAISNRAPYALFIKSPMSVASQLIWKPGAEAAERIAEDSLLGLN